MVSALLTLLFFHFQHAGSVRFKWMDSKGAIHEQDILGEGKCNEVLRSGTSIDTGLIIDKQFLPIKQVLYGPMLHENQRMKITVGPVKCTPSVQALSPLESHQDEGLNIEGEIEVKKNNKFPSVLNHLGKEYSIEFQIEVNKEFSTPEYLNVFRMTSTDNNCCNHGDRIPSLFVNKNKNLYYATSIGNHGKYVFTFPYELNRTYRFMISQTQSHAGKFEYCAKIDDVIFHCVSNDQPRSFENVLLYFSDPWHESFENHGKLSNLKINNLRQPTGDSMMNDYSSKVLKIEKENEDIIDQLEQLIPCPLENSNFRLIHGRCIYFESQQMDYGTARSNCKTKVSGFDGNLFAPANVFISEKVHKTAMEVFGDLPKSNNLYKGEFWLNNGHRVWIGVNDQVLEGTFRYDQRETSPSFNAWFQTQPNNMFGNEDCVEFNLFDKALWNDNPCSVQQLSICEFVPKRCPLENPKYRLIQSRCFFFESQKLDFDAAQENCLSKIPGGGKLFEPTSQYMNERIAKEAIEVIGSGRKWTGVHDRQVEGTFAYASNGLSLAFTPVWATNNPSNSGPTGENCIECSGTCKKWNDNSCAAQLMSVCESK